MRSKMLGTGLLVAITVVALAACGADSILNDTIPGRVEGSGRLVVESRAVDGFSAISFSTEGLILLTQGDSESVTVEADDNLMPYLDTTVTDGVLTIETRRDLDIVPSQDITWEITVVDLKSIELTGAGRVEIANLTSDGLDLTVTGAMDVAIDHLNAPSLDVTVDGVGSVVISGESDRESLTLSGTGSIDTSGLSAREATAVMSGAGDITLWVTDSLDATITGVGHVDYYGSPTLTQVVSGAGAVRRLGFR